MSLQLMIFMVSFPYSKKNREEAKREELARLNYKLEQEEERLKSVRPLLEEAKREEADLLRIKNEIGRLRSSRGEGPWVYKHHGPSYRKSAAARSVSSSDDDERKISRRRLLKIGLAAAAGIAITATGVGFVLNMPDPNDYEGTIHSLSGSDSRGEYVYYTDICHGADKARPGIRTELYSVMLNNDAGYRCGRSGIETGNFAFFHFRPTKKYPVGEWDEYNMTGEEIRDACNLGARAVMRKGEKIDERAWWLDRVIKFE